jgi:hypothetical protein
MLDQDRGTWIQGKASNGKKQMSAHFSSVATIAGGTPADLYHHTRPNHPGILLTKFSARAFCGAVSTFNRPWPWVSLGLEDVHDDGDGDDGKCCCG